MPVSLHLGQYRFLVNGEAEASVKRFIDTDHTLEEYIQVGSVVVFQTSYRY